MGYLLISISIDYSYNLSIYVIICTGMFVGKFLLSYDSRLEIYFPIVSYLGKETDQPK